MLKNPSNLYISILNNPYGVKYYKDLMEYYNDIGMINEAKAIQYLLKESFEEIHFLNDNSSDNSQESN